MTDATFAEGAPPAVLRAEDPEDLAVLSALLQDAVGHVAQMRHDAQRRRFALLVSRYCWEDPARTERVSSLLVVSDVLAVASQGVARGDDVVVSVLTLSFQPGPDGTGVLTLVLAGDGAIRLDVECIDLTLRDVCAPWPAAAGHAPAHD
jgi:hypothetical protein